ncbi:MAG: primosomal replication protein N [Sulfurimicrobium sp.]|nr:primosomal replication protein N [Sulfurimicrobium sp.]MDO9188483.1 primosomal replication protein N [Sulfurimicrobium sp.]MDP1704595.1 primosomal replication protein N [Sulfurimicrobium sp.]MDP2198854.1 primosomal replication protein N [Sulfurimicrobium sp.]MDP3688358.1 primosomal replication protein N [Sulfurimicrobium sp.]
MSGNRIVLSGKILAIDPLRYTPAGIPALNLTLGHSSRQVEAGMEREVECEVQVVALGELAQQAARCKVEDGIRIQGFLARKSRNSMQLVLHANRIELIEI